MSPDSHRDDIQGLRAVAVLLVALNHAGVGFLPGGYVGVDVFFVLSGFLITRLLLSTAVERGSVSLVDFYVRRGRRILPAAALTLVVTDLVATKLLNFVRAKEIVQDSIPASLFTANIHFAHQGTDYFARGQPPSPLQHFWSLSVEEQFYVVWPVVLAITLFGIARLLRSRILAPPHVHPGVSAAAIRRLSAVVVLIAAGSLGWSIYYTHHDAAAAYFSTFDRAWELAVGAALAVSAAQIARLAPPVRAALGWLGLAAVAVAAVWFSAATPFPGYAALLPILGGALIIAAGIGGDRPRLGPGRWLGLAPLRYVGDRSYAFYLWHWPALVIAADYEGRALSRGVNLLLLAGAFLLSVVTYRYFENPLRRGQPVAGAPRAWLRRRLGPYGLAGASPEPGIPGAALRGLLVWPASVLAAVLAATLALSSIQTTESRLAAASVAGATPGFVPATPAAQPSGPVIPQAPVTAPGQVLPAVVAAVEAARRAAPIPSPLNPPPGALLNFTDPAVVFQFPNGCAAGSDNQATSQVCSFGSTSSPRSIVVMGDSHAEMWMPAILQMALQDGWAVRPLVKSGCTPSGWLDAAYGTSACRTWYRWAIGQARALHPAVTLIGANYGAIIGPQAAAELRGITSFTASMKPFSKHVVLIADNDAIDKQPVDCLLAHGATMATCTSTRTPEEFSLNDDLAAAAPQAGFAYLATRGWFCFQFQCPAVIGHTVVYRDMKGHITGAYALAIATEFRASFRQAIGLSNPAPGGAPTGVRKPAGR